MITIVLFIAQMLVVGFHSLEHMDHVHDCTHHDYSIDADAGDISVEHDECHFCSRLSPTSQLNEEQVAGEEYSPCCDSLLRDDMPLARHLLDLSNRRRGPPVLS